MVKSDRVVNPVDAERRREKSRDIKRHREQRRVQRDAKIERSSPDDIRGAIEAINRAGRTARLTSKQVEERERLVAQLANAQQRKQQPTHDNVTVTGLERILGGGDGDGNDRNGHSDSRHDVDDTADSFRPADTDNGYAQNTPHVAVRASYNAYASLPSDAAGVIHLTQSPAASQHNTTQTNRTPAPSSQQVHANAHNGPRPNPMKRRREVAEESDPLLAYLNEQSPTHKRPATQPRLLSVSVPTIVSTVTHSAAPSAADASTAPTRVVPILKPAFLPPQLQVRHQTHQPAALHVPTHHMPSVPMSTSVPLSREQDASVFDRSSSLTATTSTTETSAAIDDAVDAFIATLG